MLIANNVQRTLGCVHILNSSESLNCSAGQQKETCDVSFLLFLRLQSALHTVQSFGRNLHIFLLAHL